MKKFALIGRDVQGSFSPFIHRYCFKKLSLDAEYDILDISDVSDIPNIIELLKSKKLDGVNITTPYKKDFILYLNEINPRAESIGSINCIHQNNGKLIGNNTDWYGFAKSVKEIQNYDNVVIFGSGGVVSSLIYYFSSRKSCPVHIIARDQKKLEGFKDNNTDIYNIDQFQFSTENALIINTIPQKANIDWKNLINMLSGKVIYALDLNYHLKATEFLNSFNPEIRNKNGLDMLISQALMSIDIWYNENFSKAINIDDLRNKIMNKYYNE